MNARKIVERAVAVKSQLQVLLNDVRTFEEALPHICWRVSPKTWAVLIQDNRVVSEDMVDAENYRLLGIQVKKDLGPHPGDLILQLAIEDRQNGGLG